MTDYISRDAAKQILSRLLTEDAAECACNLIDSVLPADVEPVRRGRWIGKPGPYQGECSVCGYMTFDKSADWARKYWGGCPKCRAKMDLEGETNDD